MKSQWLKGSNMQLQNELKKQITIYNWFHFCIHGHRVSFYLIKERIPISTFIRGCEIIQNIECTTVCSLLEFLVFHFWQSFFSVQLSHEWSKTSNLFHIFCIYTYQHQHYPATSAFHILKWSDPLANLKSIFVHCALHHQSRNFVNLPVLWLPDPVVSCAHVTLRIWGHRRGRKGCKGRNQLCW